MQNQDFPILPERAAGFGISKQNLANRDEIVLVGHSARIEDEASELEGRSGAFRLPEFVYLKYVQLGDKLHDGSKQLGLIRFQALAPPLLSCNLSAFVKVSHLESNMKIHSNKS